MTMRAARSGGLLPRCMTSLNTGNEDGSATSSHAGNQAGPDSSSTNAESAANRWSNARKPGAGKRPIQRLVRALELCA